MRWNVIVSLIEIRETGEDERWWKGMTEGYERGSEGYEAGIGVIEKAFCQQPKHSYTYLNTEDEKEEEGGDRGLGEGSKGDKEK